MDALLDYLDAIEEILDNSKKIPFTDRVSVEKDKILDIINEIRLDLPGDIRQAQRLLNDYDRIINDAHSKAQDILEAAEEEAKIRTAQHEIFRRASDQATDIVESAKQSAKDLRGMATAYAASMLEKAEKQLKEYIDNIEEQHSILTKYYRDMIDVIYENRQQFHSAFPNNDQH